MKIGSRVLAQYTYSTDGDHELTKLTYGSGSTADYVKYSYDDQGRVIKEAYRTYGWKEGRKLATMTGGGKTWTFSYGADGLRTGRADGSDSYTYWYDSSGKLTQYNYNAVVMRLTYDTAGRPVSVTYNGVVYYYILNQQGDVMGIVNTDGVVVVEYTYDAWGRLLTTEGTMKSGLGRENPLRYRGYVYDRETGLYYVSSRYYDPEIGRWVNADDVDYLGAGDNLTSYNLFAYCGNNPVMGYDPTGHWDWGVFGKIILTTAVVAVCLTGVGAIASAAVAATAATATTVAVTTAVATAGLSTAISAVDGAICAEQSGGKWYDGAMAGAIGGSIGAVVSAWTNPMPGSDSALRMNTAGRAASSLTYDLTYEVFNSGKISSSSIAGCAIDVVMDITLSPIAYYYSGGITSGYIRSAINGFVDGAIDVFQTGAYFTI